MSVASTVTRAQRRRGPVHSAISPFATPSRFSSRSSMPNTQVMKAQKLASVKPSRTTTRISGDTRVGVHLATRDRLKFSASRVRLGLPRGYTLGLRRQSSVCRKA